MAETIEKSSCIKNGHCRHLRTNPGNQSFARKRTIRKMAITDKSLKIAVFPIILALVRHFMQFERDFFPAACT
ncbi:hypothetical protein [Ligilactobacillus ruminis]|uniref:hypothetical protein n=1 Tax=Ligilactobacillus ruminis TaxID=1623 RepID=UPI00233159C0|nr:hypothetical protein [Ligilactobacillus ruminis]